MVNEFVKYALNSIGHPHNLTEIVVENIVRAVSLEKSRLQMLLPALQGYDQLRQHFLVKIAQCEKAVSYYEKKIQIH